MRAVGRVRELALEATRLAGELELAVVESRRQGTSWRTIAAALEVNRSTHGYTRALGELFPGGVSSTTVRKMYGPAVERADERARQ